MSTLADPSPQSNSYEDALVDVLVTSAPDPVSITLSVMVNAATGLGV